MAIKNIYFWSALNRFGTQAIGFVGNVLIARQLSPDDYGLVAMLAIIIGIAWNFSESGFSDVLIQKNDADKKDFGTVLTYNVAVGLFMYIIIYFTAPIISKYFERNELINIARILGLTILIKSLTVTEFARLRKELKFKEMAIILILSGLFSTTIAYLAALNGYGYWALVILQIATAIFSLVFILIFSKWKPYFYFSRKRFSAMSGFSFNLLISYFANQIGQNLYAFFIGKYYSAYALGFYRQAQKIKDAPIKGLNSIILSTTYPLLAKEKNETIRRKMYNNLLNKFLFLQFSLSFFLIGSAYPVISIVFGEKWLPTVPYFQLMIIAYLFYPLTTLNSNIAKIYGQAKLYRNLTFVRNGLFLVALIITLKFSIIIILWGQIVAFYISVTIDIIMCGKLIDFGILKQLKITITQLWIPLIAMIVAYIVSYIIANTLLIFIAYLLVFTIVFFMLNVIAKNVVFFDIKSKVLNRIFVKS